MIKVIVEKQTVVTLTLTEWEALWLKTLVQNPIWPNENHEQAEMRKRFWEALQEVK